MPKLDMSLALAQTSVAPGPASLEFHSTPELVGLVAGYLPQEDLLSARLMNNAWRHEAPRQLPVKGMTLKDFSFFAPEADDRYPRDKYGEDFDESQLSQYIKKRQFLTITRFVMADRKKTGTLMSEVKTWAQFKEKFPNVKLIEDVPMRFKKGRREGMWTTGTIEVDPSRPDTPTCWVQHPQTFMGLQDTLDVDFPYPPGMIKSFNLIAQPPTDTQEEAVLASFLSNPPPIHAIQTFGTGMNPPYTEEGFKSFLQALSAKSPHERIRSLSLLYETRGSVDAYARSTASMREICPFGSEGLQSLQYRHHSGSMSPPDHSCLGSEAFAAACDGINTLEYDVKRIGVLPGTAESVETPQIPPSLRKLTLNYPWGEFPPVDFAQTLVSCIEKVDPNGRLEVKVGCVNPSGCLNRGQEAKAINSWIEERRASRQAKSIGGSTTTRFEDVSDIA